MRVAKPCFAISAIFLMATPALAIAQGQGDLPQSQEGSPDANDIVVTGTRRAVRLQDVAVSVTAVSDEAIKSAGYSGASDHAVHGAGPDVQSAAWGGFRRTQHGRQGFDYSLERAVGVVIDDMVQGQPQNLGFSTFGDIDHVEVLKGPQGTLFGKNASAGVVYAVTKRPEMGVSSLEGSLAYGERNEIKVNQTVNLPLAHCSRQLSMATCCLTSRISIRTPTTRHCSRA